MLVNKATMYTLHVALVDAAFLMTSTPSISLGTKFLTLIYKTPELYHFARKKNKILLCSVVDDLYLSWSLKKGKKSVST